MELPDLSPSEKDAADLLSQAIFALDRQQFENCIELVNKILETVPDHLLALPSRAMSYYHLGKYEEAIEDFTNTIYHDPSEKGYFHDLGLCYQQVGKHAQAVNCFSIAVRHQRGYAHNYPARAKGRFILRQYRKCILDVDRYVRLYKKRTSFRKEEDKMGALLKGMSWFYLKKYPLASSSLNEALEINNQESLACYYLALLNILNNQWDNATQNLSKAIWHNPSYNIYYLFRALAKLKNANKEGAQSDYDKLNDTEHANHAQWLFAGFEKIKTARLNRKGEMELLSTKTKVIYRLPTHADISKCIFFKEKYQSFLTL